LSVLYIINTSATENLKRSLQRLTSNDALLLIESAVMIVNSGHLAETILSESIAEKNIYVLESDLLARGIQLSDQLRTIQRVAYDGVVRLAVAHHLSCYLK
jgi:sulfur relay protein TusB/DsrH